MPHCNEKYKTILFSSFTRKYALLLFCSSCQAPLCKCAPREGCLDDEKVEINDLLLDDDEKEAKSILWDEITRESLPYSWLRKINNQDTNIEDINISSVLDSQKVSHKKRKCEYKNQDITDTNNNKDQKPETAVESILMALDKNNKGTNKYLNSDTLAKLFTIY